jgi:hypothetical protein
VAASLAIWPLVFGGSSLFAGSAVKGFPPPCSFWSSGSPSHLIEVQKCFLAGKSYNKILGLKILIFFVNVIFLYKNASVCILTSMG